MRHSTTLFVLSLLMCIKSLAQGCSDAGFCTMGAMKPDQNYSKRIAVKLRSLEVNYYHGKSLLSPVIHATTLDFNIGINDLSSFQIKLPYQWINGSLGDNAGMGDISLSYSRLLKATNKWNINGTLGTKIPTNDGNATVSNAFTEGREVPLHMYYQTSLGSFDAIAGLAALSSKWLFATGIQIALTENNNQFAWADFPSYPSQEYLEKYNQGPELHRGIDVMLRAERNWRFTNFNFSLGLLPIFRITKDETRMINSEERIKRDRTVGLAMSLIGSFGYQFDVNSGIKFIPGLKLTDRDVNPDGLTRKHVLSVSYVYKF